jgi:hypothetical protein
MNRASGCVPYPRCIEGKARSIKRQDVGVPGPPRWEPIQSHDRLYKFSRILFQDGPSVSLSILSWMLHQYVLIYEDDPVKKIYEIFGAAFFRCCTMDPISLFYYPYRFRHLIP